MVDVAMECHGNRFRTSDHAMASLAPPKETLFDQTHMQLPDKHVESSGPSRRRHEAL